MKKVLVFLLTLVLAGGAVFAQDGAAQEKFGLTITTEVGLGDIANPDVSSPFTSGTPSDNDFKAGTATWRLPQLEFGKTVGKWTFNGMARLAVSSSKTINAPVYSDAEHMFKVTYQVADAVKVWGQIGDGVTLKPGFSYSSGPITAQLEIPLKGTLFTKPQVQAEPMVTYSASGFLVYLKAVFNLADVTHPDGRDDDGWEKFVQNENLSVIEGLEFRAAYTIGAANIRATFWVPLYAHWQLDDRKVGSIGGFPAALAGAGIKITPRVAYTIGAATLYAQADIGNIGIDSDTLDRAKAGVSVQPAFGVSYAF